MANVLCASHEWNLGFEELRELSNAGFRVIPVSTGLDAIKQFAAREIDVIVLNQRLPDGPVSDLVSYFRHHDQGIPIVMLSVDMPVQSQAGVDAVIHKYSCAQLLVPTLEVLMQSRPAKEVARDDDSFAQAA